MPDDFALARKRMVARQLAGRGITDKRLLAAMGEVPRERFVSDAHAAYAYDDSPLPIEADQTISQPYIVALMIEAAEIAPGDRVLEIGAGSGYAAAVMGRIAGQVIAVERHGELAELAAARMTSLGYDNVRIVHGDGTRGLPGEAPFEAILAAASGSHVPEVLIRQLSANGGTLVMPVGEPAAVQNLVKVKRVGEDEFEEEDLGPVRFVPLIGEHGWGSGGKSLSGGQADSPDGDAPAAPFREAEEGDGPGSQALIPAKAGIHADAAPNDAARTDPSLRRDNGKSGAGNTIEGRIAVCAEPLPDIEDPEFAKAFDRFAHARVVLLGEASHGTSEFYHARAAITERLVRHHGFSIVAVEADWPDAAHIDRYVRHRGPREGESEPAFQRFPTWMWRNREVESFIRWLRRHNEGHPPAEMAGFYGLDLYNLGGSMRAVIDYLDDVDPDAARLARERYGCLMPWSRDPALYGRLAITEGYARCEDEVVDMLRDLHARRLKYTRMDGEEWLDAAANARLVKNAEAYYRAMYHGAAHSWNLRDTHMFETLCMLLGAPGAAGTGSDAEAAGQERKAVVWAHNSHIGNAAHTEMGQVRDELNIGQLCKERFGDAARLIGFGTHTGTVAAATDWDGEMEVKEVRPSMPGSYERLCHDSGVERFLLDLREHRGSGGRPGDEPPQVPGAQTYSETRPESPLHIQLRAYLMHERLERFIGVIYRPETERWSHYAQAILPLQFDAWVWFDETVAVTPLAPEPPARGGEEATWPFGL